MQQNTKSKNTQKLRAGSKAATLWLLVTRPTAGVDVKDFIYKIATIELGTSL